MREAVVFIHGIWMTGLEMSLLRRRVARRGYACHQFTYRSLLRTPHDNAAALNRYLESIDADVIHLLAHSLGGIVLLHLFERFPLQRPGGVLMLGSPVQGSAIAARLVKLIITRPLLGWSIEQGLLGGAPAWGQIRNIGMIAGNRGHGVGKLLLGGLEDPSDGTVAVSETEAPWINIHLTVPASHFGMLFSAPVAEAICRYLASGDFAGEDIASKDIE